MATSMQGSTMHGTSGLQTIGNPYQNSQFVVPSHKIVYQKPGDLQQQMQQEVTLGKKEEKESHYSKHMSSRASFGMSHRQGGTNVPTGHMQSQ